MPNSTELNVKQMIGKKLSEAIDSVDSKELEDEITEEQWEVLLYWMLETAPRDILTSISEYFTDEEKWERRSMCKAFYDSYYNQKIDDKNYEAFDFNGKRAVMLARKYGRVFKRVKGLDIYHALEFSMTDADLQAINAHHFPCLEALWIRGKSTTSKAWDDPLRKTSLRHLSHPRMNFLQVRPAQPSDLQWVTEERFPRLERLRIYHKYKLEVLPPHSRLISISPRLPLDYSTWDLITRSKYPKLRRIKIKQHDLRFDERLVETLQRQYKSEGIDLQMRKRVERALNVQNQNVAPGEAAAPPPPPPELDAPGEGPLDAPPVAPLQASPEIQANQAPPLGLAAFAEAFFHPAPS